MFVSVVACCGILLGVTEWGGVYRSGAECLLVSGMVSDCGEVFLFVS